MNAFRVLLMCLVGFIVPYTVAVVGRRGWGFIDVFFGDIYDLSWAGQFNADFTSLLVLSAIWMAWRNRFSSYGILLGVLGLLGGISVLAPYLIYLSFSGNGDGARMLLGERYDQMILPK
ncbi:hypothetical protein [Fundidesulfovibrio magnetotacticus]|uniref:hypothetical protein n=1 Tax=Fundidesulfovibrio magnetotacticus TaxID=2730080 RepID=UPI0015636056|nr:hypothetical protein [Fundidesulfovibrio magnetotacticus]